jgi:hypothetical protein
MSIGIDFSQHPVYFDPEILLKKGLSTPDCPDEETGMSENTRNTIK